MRVLFSSLATHGHTYPLLPLATAAVESGHEVLYATSETFHPVVSKLGAEPVAAGVPIRDAFMEAGAELFTDGVRREDIPPEQLQKVISRVFGSVLPRRFLDDLGPVLESRKPDLVVAEAGNMGAAFAGKLAGIPVVVHSFGRAPSGESANMMGDAIREFAQGLGLEGPMYSREPYLDIYPPSLQDKDFLRVRENRVALRPVAFTEPGELRLPGGDKPLVYLTLGTAFGHADVLRQAIEGLAALPVNVVVATGPTVEVDTVGDVPDNVTVEAWVPQADLLPHTALVVHHGGSGTTLGAAAAGVPQLFLPQGADQFTNAEAFTEGGAGLSLLGDEISAEAVSAKAKLLLGDPAYREVARGVAEEIKAMPSPAEIASRLPEFAE